MEPKMRQKFNEAFTEEKYQAFLADLDQEFNYKIEFRVAESPLFVPRYFKKKLIRACDDIINVLKRSDYKDITKGAVPRNCQVPNENNHTHFLAIDFAVCQDSNGEFEPQLIELQGFPSLYFFQEFIAEKGREHFTIPESWGTYFYGLDKPAYHEILTQVITNGHPIENVILLEIEPYQQKTQIDFFCTERATGVKAICVTEIIKEGTKLFYLRDGVKTPITRIYNRVIFDELHQRTDLKLQWNLTEPVDVEWAGHPNWFFRISKYTLPYLKSKFVPATSFLNEIDTPPKDLENYVLKPLFSFAGTGVKINVTKEDLEEIEDRWNYILMKKVKYAAAFHDVHNEPVKAEIRLLFVWPDGASNPMLVNSLVRLSKGEMIGVRFNKDKDWVGGSMAYFEN